MLCQISPRERYRAALMPAALAVAMSLALPSGARACSLCIAHALGAGLSGIGAQTLVPGSWLVGFSRLSTSKLAGTDMAGMTEIEDFTQYSLDLSHGVTNRLMVNASVPFVSKSVRMTDQPTETSNGLGDMVLGVSYQLPPSVKSKALTAFTLDLKLPTGSNDERNADGSLKDQHVQPGTGSTDVSAGAIVTWEGRKQGELWFAGLRGRLNGTNSRGYHFGDALFYNVGWNRPFGPGASIVLEFNGRLAARDRTEDGSMDPNTGGHVGYLSASYRRQLGTQYGLIVSYQHPVLTSLNGIQTERGLFSFSVARSF